MSKRAPTEKQIAASKKRWHKLVERKHKAEAPIKKRMAAVEKKFDAQISRIEKRKAAALSKLWKALERKRLPFDKRIEKEIAFKLS